MSRYQTSRGAAKEPFSESATQPGKTLDALGNTVFDTAGRSLKALLWTDYQAELAAAAAGQAAALSASGGGDGGGYAGRGFVDVVFDATPPPSPHRADVCTCGGQKYGGGTCSSWCDSSAARAQHSGGAS